MIKGTIITSVIWLFFSLAACLRANKVNGPSEIKNQPDSLYVYDGISLSEYNIIINNLEVSKKYFNGSNDAKLLNRYNTLDQFVQRFGKPGYETIDTLRYGKPSNYRYEVKELDYYNPYDGTNLMQLLKNIPYVEILTAKWNYVAENLLSVYFVKIQSESIYKSIAWAKTDFSDTEWYKPYIILNYKKQLPIEINDKLGQPIKIDSERVENGIIPYNTFLLQSISCDRDFLDQSIKEIYVYDWAIDNKHTLRMCYIKNETGNYEAIGGAQADNYIFDHLWE